MDKERYDHEATPQEIIEAANIVEDADAEAERVKKLITLHKIVHDAREHGSDSPDLKLRDDLLEEILWVAEEIPHTPKQLQKKALQARFNQILLQYQSLESSNPFRLEI